MVVEVRKSSLRSLGYLTQWEMDVACREDGHSQFWLSVSISWVTILRHLMFLTLEKVEKEKHHLPLRRLHSDSGGGQPIHKFKNRL